MSEAKSSSVSFFNLFSITCFCVAALIGAFLLFQIEPLVGKVVTPLYGGTASTWTICLLFFQAVVLAGYLLTFTITKFSARTQVIAYLVLSLSAALLSRIPAGVFWQHPDVEHPVTSLLAELAIRVAVPCIFLSSVSGVMQVWFNLARLGNPYPLYSVSNFGSIVALLAYPTLVEPNLTINATLKIWSCLYWILVASIALCVVILCFRMWRSLPPQVEPTPGLGHFAAKQFAWWVSLSTMGSSILLVFTSHMTSDIAPTPLLWVLPLVVYLLSFVLVFGNQRIYVRRLFLTTWMFVVALDTVFLGTPYIFSLVIKLVLIFELFMICHGELANSKPNAVSLPAFYLAVATGGALGGLLIGIVSPILFNFEVERQAILLLMSLFTVHELLIKNSPNRKVNILVLSGIAVAFTGVLVVLWRHQFAGDIYRERNFYSAVRLEKKNGCLVFCHGKVIHGQQYLDPARADEPAGLLWPPFTFIMDFVRHYKSPANLSIGVIGLGAGEAAAYGRPDETIAFYELDPKVIRIAQRFFSYLSRSRAKITIRTGDGRAVLAALFPQHYDLLLIDAFNGDAIPCHLLTQEAFRVYLTHLKSNGLLVFHVTNAYVDLQPILGNLGKHLHLCSCSVRDNSGVSYVMMGRYTNEIRQLFHFKCENQAKYQFLQLYPTPTRASIGIWTDDFSNLFGTLKFSTPECLKSLVHAL